jgi:two-component sensor histidine kinase
MADDPSNSPVIADTLALALVAASDAPILLLDGELGVIAASASFAHAFQIDPASMPGRSLFALGGGEWDVPQLRSLLRVILSGVAQIDAYEMDLTRPGRAPRRLVINAHQLSYDDPANTRVLLAVSDVTDARLAERLKDNLLQEKAMLYEELQHRIANSLQIIASVLMQSARRATSAQTRSHLFDTHSRVMSVAALQHQLTASNVGEVRLRDYFSELAQSIGASMIRDPDKLRLEIEADDSGAAADISVSLGLIATELVINFLKHAFPNDRGGRIVVSYKSSVADWVLSVADDGVGIPEGPAPPRPGLGTSIVEALAKQLGADVSMKSGPAGTTVSVTRTYATTPSPAIISAPL